MELWDLIHAPRKKSDRFSQVQCNRTLCHPSLPQPSAAQERSHLQRIQNEEQQTQFDSLFTNSKTSNTSHKTTTDSTLSLEERLASALQKAGLGNNNNNNKQDGDDTTHHLPSPTSTLQFPVSGNTEPTMISEHGDFFENSIDGYCFYASESNDDDDDDDDIITHFDTDYYYNEDNRQSGNVCRMTELPMVSINGTVENMHNTETQHHQRNTDPQLTILNKTDTPYCYENGDPVRATSRMTSLPVDKINNNDETNILNTRKEHKQHTNSTLTTVEQAQHRTFTNNNINNSTEIVQHSPSHSFVVCADTQLGMTSGNKEWETELKYAHEAVNTINKLDPLPAFACVCGDLVDMEASFYVKEPASTPPTESSSSDLPFTMDQCHFIQDQQNEDFQRVWSELDDRIPLVCLCGNHDVGNRPTQASIDRFKSAYGDDYLAFWTNGTYNIVLNNVLFNDPSGAPDLFDEQLRWLEGRLQYARAHQAAHIFVFGHHPWFLYDEHENNDKEHMKGENPFPVEWSSSDNEGEERGAFPDYYFSISPQMRRPAMALFKEYGVSAAFSGHFHQNLVSKSSFGMDMIITAPLSMVFESTGKPKDRTEVNGRGVRVVRVHGDGSFDHHFKMLESEGG